jgi:hypothetical protein
MSVATIINFCSNEYRFLAPCVREAKKFSKSIHISLADHFFDGKKEDLSLLEKVFQEFPDVKFFVYPFVPGTVFGKNYSASDTVHLWHSVSRMVSFFFLSRDTDYVLFLDADEIVDGKFFQDWLRQFPHQDFDFIKLYCYWYFREPRYQAKVWETSPLFAKRKRVKRSLIMQKDERTGMFEKGKGKKKEGTLGAHQLPMVHHYSWVRTKEEMLKKVGSWGHQKDKDWAQLVHREFASDFRGRDFVHGYEFNDVKPFIEMDFGAKPSDAGVAATNVKYLSVQELFRIVFGWPGYLLRNRLNP